MNQLLRLPLLKYTHTDKKTYVKKNKINLKKKKEKAASSSLPKKKE